ncbi:heavy metal translocating P-type ATPase [Kutzneria buriramensis]|uniref:Heavy metal-(Cd/Co/Hg/Pb/Zn)-translocating P-type ATPase n=1 Tax=Kutzneria buriramensis TaxID=1045776 RepID=A0A3E0H0B0_9PSEU|nr:heavy metal translocating P-type ATPase [Kutzneria buriramensis]REH34812.1 heavy metal-(Cd/Co/Hg/Pb/Zn)-translocating P-type ATPase [Kutzneria buriramensis]
MERFARALLVLTAAAVAVGLVLWALDTGWADVAWAVGAAAALVPAVWWAVVDLRAGRLGADVLAVLALGGTLAVGEYLAGAVIGVMLATGRVLELYAERRAGRDLSALLDRSPTRTRLRVGDELTPVDVDRVAPGDTVVVLPGEIVPVDGRLAMTGTFDQSALTGEPLPVERLAGEQVSSGVVNAGGAVDIVAVRPAVESTYAGIVRLAGAASANAAPVARLADRYAAVFLPFAVVIAAIAWALTGDAVRAVAVLVTATPCPLLLAVPIAVTAGMSRASRQGVVVRDGRALEALGRAETAVLDKTGTVTVGAPTVTDVLTAPGRDRDAVLRTAAAVETLSSHVLASAIVDAARPLGIPPATDVSEEPGQGATGTVDGEVVTVGRPPRKVPSSGWAVSALRRAALDGATPIWVTIGGKAAGVVLAKDEIRLDAARTLRRLRAVGLRRIVLLTGDRVDTAADVGGLLGFDDVQAESTPETKVERVAAERSQAVTLMVGDGLNDAPALATADVGVALSARGATAAAQAADAVILSDRIDPLADAVETASHARRIAVQSAATGLGLSVAAMGVAAFGLLPPVAGALVQELIDVAVILNSLRALLPNRHRRLRVRDRELLRRFAGEHELLVPVRAAVRAAADSLADGATELSDTETRRAYRLLVDHLLPHERAEEHELYPAVGEMLGSSESTATMSRGHAEIERLVRRLARHLSEGPVQPGQVDDLRATLYGLDAVLTLHFAQEEQGYFSLTPNT